MPKAMKDFEDKIAQVLQDAAAKLSPDDRKAFILQAITQRYSKDRPREIVSDHAGDGTSDLALPSAAGATFEEDFSRIKQIEYPIGDLPPTLIEDDEWQFYRTPAALKVRLLTVKPTAAESVRFTWTTTHKEDGTTVAVPDFDAVCDYAAGLCFAALAAKFAQVGDPTIGADTVNYRTKSQEYMALAKAAKQRYFDHLGIDAGGAVEGGSVGPAVSVGEVDQDLGLAGDRLTHPRRSR